MSKHTIVLCAVIFISVASVSSQPYESRAIKNRRDAAVREYIRIMNVVTETKKTIESAYKHAMTGMTALEGEIGDMYTKESRYTNILNCRSQSVQLKKTILADAKRSKACIIKEADTVSGNILQAIIQFERRVDNHINAQDPDEWDLNDIDQFLANQKNWLNSVRTSFEASRNKCIANSMDIKNLGNAIQLVLTNFKKCVNAYKAAAHQRY